MQNAARPESRPTAASSTAGRRRIRRLSGRIALAGTALLFGSTEASAQLVVDKLDLALTPAHGRRTVGAIGVTNSSDSPVQAVLTRGDWDRDVNGDNRFLPQGSTGRSCGELLSVTPTVLRIEPGSTDSLRVIVNGMPADGRECWDIVFVEQQLQQKPPNGSALVYQFRTAVKLYVLPQGLQKDAEIENMSVGGESAAARPVERRGAVEQAALELVIDFRNMGDVHLLAKGTVEIRRLDNSVAAAVPIEEFPTLPGALRRLRVGLPADLPSSRYVILALIDFGGQEIAAGQLEIETP